MGKPIICGPGVFESMSREERPSRSELLDVSNAILDGVDCLVLSKETVSGPNIINALITLDCLCKEAESAIYQKQLFSDLSLVTKTPIEVIYSIAISTVETSMKCQAAAIIVLTISGKSAKTISRFRPRCPIVAVTSNMETARHLILWRGICPVYYISK